MSGPSVQTVQKARRLISDDRITILASERDLIVATVLGDTGRYLTAIVRPELTGEAPNRSCTCEAGRAGQHACSHELALAFLLYGGRLADANPP